MQKVTQDPIKIVFPTQRLNKSLRVLIAVNTMLVFVIGMFGPFYAIFIQKIGGTITIAGLSWALFGIVTGILTLLFARWELRVKRQVLLLALSYAIRTVAFLSYAFMDSLLQLLITQVLWGVAAAIGSPAFDSAYSSYTDHKQAVAQWASWEGVSSIASGLSALVGGFVIEVFGFRLLFLMMSGVMFFLSVYLWRLPKSFFVYETVLNPDDEMVRE